MVAFRCHAMVTVLDFYPWPIYKPGFCKYLNPTRPHKVKVA
jgi:hypothetical protein